VVLRDQLVLGRQEIPVGEVPADDPLTQDPGHDLGDARRPQLRARPGDLHTGQLISKSFND
jgi:hypothetical protein